MRPIPADRSLVMLDFNSTRVDGPQGRRFYSMFIFFVRAGYYPLINKNYLFLHNISSRYKKLCLQEEFSLFTSPAEINHPYVLVTDKKDSLYAAQATKVLVIDHKPDYKDGDGTYPYPFPMFPSIYAEKKDLQIDEYRQIKKQWRVFFGGGAKVNEYDKASIRNIYKKIPRGEVLDILRKKLPKNQWIEPADSAQLDDLLQSEFNGMVLVNTDYCRIPVEQWLSVLSLGSFYLACPGVRYPMSHNSIEAMAVGSVPIIQYPELFYPSLTDGENCLVYKDAESLIKVVSSAMSMTAEEINRLSKGASDYYDQYLSPQQAVGRLMSAPEKQITVRLAPFLRSGADL